MKKDKNGFVSRLLRVCFALGYLTLFTTAIAAPYYRRPEVNGQADIISPVERRLGDSWGKNITIIRSYEEIKNWNSPARQFLIDHANKDLSLEEMIPIAKQNFFFLTGKEIPSELRIEIGTLPPREKISEYTRGRSVVLSKDFDTTEGFSALGHELGHLVSGEITDEVLWEAAARAFEYIWMYSYEEEKTVRREESVHSSDFATTGKVKNTMALALLHRMWPPGTDPVNVFKVLEENDRSKLDDIN